MEMQLEHRSGTRDTSHHPCPWQSARKRAKWSEQQAWDCKVRLLQLLPRGLQGVLAGQRSGQAATLEINVHPPYRHCSMRHPNVDEKCKQAVVILAPCEAS